MHLELEESKLLNKKSMGCGSRICLSKTFISSTGHRQHEAPNKSPENWMNRRDTGEKEAGDPLLFPAEQRWMGKRCCRKKPPRNFTLLSQCFLHFVKEKPDCFMVQYSKSREVAQNCAINQVNSQHPFSPASNQVKTISINTSNVYINKTNANHNQRGFWSVIYDSRFSTQTAANFVGANPHYPNLSLLTLPANNVWKKAWMPRTYIWGKTSSTGHAIILYTVETHSVLNSWISCVLAG